MIESRCGHFIHRKEGYQAFIPKGLPPDPPLNFDTDLQTLLSDADRSIARLDGVAFSLPNRDLFVAMFVKKEAYISSKIKGTQATLRGVLEFEADIPSGDNATEVNEIINYLKAINFGLNHLNNGTISLDLIKEIHRILIGGTRGSDARPGEFRTEQNFVGIEGAEIYDADYIPPPPEYVDDLLSNLESFIETESAIPPLVKIALIHSQFETIHPFLDGNGRMGRLLITFYLCGKGILSNPLLYLSIYINSHKEEYTDLLNRTRTDGDLESWVKFFLKGVIEVSKEAEDAARRIIELRENNLKLLIEHDLAGANTLKLVNILFYNPIVSIPKVADLLEVSTTSASNIVSKFEKIGILAEITGKPRYKNYIFTDYMAIIEKGTKG